MREQLQVAVYLSVFPNTSKSVTELTRLSFQIVNTRVRESLLGVCLKLVEMNLETLFSGFLYVP